MSAFQHETQVQQNTATVLKELAITLAIIIIIMILKPVYHKPSQINYIRSLWAAQRVAHKLLTTCR